MTPMLDLAFVLLIIFIITAPMMGSRVDLIIPTTKARRDAIPVGKVLMIEVNRENQMEVEGRVLNETQLRERVRAMRQANKEMGIVIKPDRSLTLEKVFPLLDTLKSLGVTDVSFMAKPDPR